MAGFTTNLIDRIRYLWEGPNESVVPEDDSQPETGGVITRSGETFLIPHAYIEGISVNDDSILKRGGALGLKLYDDLLDDDVAFSNFQSRRLDVISREWDVLPGDEDDARSVEAAEHLKQQLKALPFDRICNKMLYGIWYGYAVGEGLYKLGPDGKYWLSDVVIPDRAWFAFNHKGEARFRPGFALVGEELPPNKFWVMRTGASHDFAFYGLGLAHWCYWPIWFKRQTIRFWAFYLEKLGYPTVVVEATEGMSNEELTSLMQAAVAIGRDRAARLPPGYISEKKLEKFEGSRSGSGVSDYLDMVKEQNESLMRVIRGQPGTSSAQPSGLGSGQSEVHQDEAEKIAKADADLLCESFNSTFPVWLTRWNFGEDVAPPRVYRKFEEEEALDDIAARDKTLHEMNIRRTPESIKETYGDGYEYHEPEPIVMPGAPPAPGAKGVAPPSPANDDEAKKRAERRASFAAEDVAPLYVYRELRAPSVAPLVKFIRSAGIPNPTPAADLHTTIINSKTAVDWFALSDGWAYNSELKVAEGGARKIARLDGGAIVLRYASDDQEWSHRRKVEQGASHDYSDYKPHITLGHDPDGTFDIESLDAPTLELVFGPEIFARVKPWLPPGITPVEFSAAEEDAIERLAASLADETNPIMLEFGAALRNAIEGLESPEAVRVALLETFEQLPADRMTRLLGLPLLAERMKAEAGLEP